MYHCYVQFYLIGSQNNLWDIIKEMPPLEHFSHEFQISGKPDSALAAKADVILADLQGINAKETVHMLCNCKKKEAKLLLLVDNEQIASFADELSHIKDIWPLAMSEDETRFRFLRFQQIYKMSKDFWQTRNYLHGV